MFTHKVGFIIEPFLYYTHTAQELGINQMSSHMTIVASSTVMQCLLSAVKAGSVFLGRICTSVVNLAPALRAPLDLSNLNSITSPIIVEAIDVILCLLRSSCEVDCVTYQCEPCCRHS